MIVDVYGRILATAVEYQSRSLILQALQWFAGQSGETSVEVKKRLFCQELTEGIMIRL